MVDILTEAEDKGIKVQILGHVPPGDDDCLQAYSWNYYRIISRFSHIITGQFFGHIHKDFFNLYYDAETLTEPRSVAFIGPPGTAYPRNNMGFRLYEFDSTSYELLDYHTYYADIEEANVIGDETKMPWRKEYSAKEEYQLDDMSARSWADFANRMQTDHDLFMKYQTNVFVNYSPEMEPCGLACRRHRVCQTYQGLSYTPDSWCEHFFPTTLGNVPNSATCSARFIKLAD